ncbi:MAG: TonB-dependent receptor domain-containing protein [Flavisolibacter sp.]
MMKPLLSLFLLSFFVSKSYAQEETAPPVPLIQINSNALYGKVIDGKTNKGIDAVSVQLYKIKSDGSDSLITAMLTKPNGDFRFRNLQQQDSLKLVLTAVGYANQELSIDFSNKQDNQEALQKDLGNLLLTQNVQMLAGIVITAQKPAMEIGVDRRVFNVDKSLTSTGGTAIDVMKNIPSVTVDVDGNVELRNSSPQIFVDGRPTILTLDQIPADNIEKIELITNPSAKFDASSSGGIINVVLKRNKRIGLNGIVSAGGGSPDILNGNLSINARQGKFNVFASGSYNQSGGKSKGQTLRQNKKDGVVENYFNQNSTNDRQRRFRSLRFGTDFFLDNRNTVSLTQGIVKGRFSNEENQDQEYLNNTKVLERYGKRFSEGNSEFNHYNTQFNYTHKFPEAGKELSANVNYNYGNGKNTTNILNNFYSPDGSPYSDPATVRNEGSNNNNNVTFQVDFSNPISESTKFEMGARSYINNYKNIFNAFALDNGNETLLPLSSNIKYREMVNAFYFTYSNKIKNFSYQAGLRAEQSKFDGELVDSAKKFGYKYPGEFKNIFDALFPSLFLTQQVGENTELQLNYSRRIRRPNFWQLNPFIDINDPVNISQGNPQLRPEFTNSFEFNYNQRYEKGNFLASVYYRNNQGDITRYSDTISMAQYQQLNNAAVDPNAILNTFINAQYTNRLGAEFTLQHKLGKNFDITPSINFQYRKVKADIGDLNLSNSGFNWDSKLIANYKIETGKPSFFNNFGFQVTGEYESPEVVPQGKRLEQYSVDFALRKDFLKDKKAALTFSINDVFNTNKYGSIYDTENFYQESFRRWNVRSFRLNFSLKFGKADFKLFNKNTQKTDDDE